MVRWLTHGVTRGRDAVAQRQVSREERVWNQTIADITLLALGTSAPQISLSIVDAIKQLGKDDGQG